MILSIIASEYYHTLRVNNGNPIAKKKTNSKYHDTKRM